MFDKGRPIATRNRARVEHLSEKWTFMWYGLHCPQPDLFTTRRVLKESSYVGLYFPHHCSARAKSLRTAQFCQGGRGYKVDTPNQGGLASVYLHWPELM